MADLMTLFSDLQAKQQAATQAQAQVNAALAAFNTAQQYSWHGLPADIQALQTKAANELQAAQTALDSAKSAASQAWTNFYAAKQAAQAGITGFGVGTGNEL